MAAHPPATRKKAANTKTKKKANKTYRDENGVSNIEKYNARKKEITTKKRVDLVEELTKQRDKMKVECDRAEDLLVDSNRRALEYQAQVGRLNRELWEKRTGAFLLGGGLAFLISYLVIHLY